MKYKYIIILIITILVVCLGRIEIKRKQLIDNSSFQVFIHKYDNNTYLIAGAINLPKDNKDIEYNIGGYEAIGEVDNKLTKDDKLTKDYLNSKIKNTNNLLIDYKIIKTKDIENINLIAKIKCNGISIQKETTIISNI